jgi:pimeloyl-ACP methyl ester carboxylesterase
MSVRRTGTGRELVWIHGLGESSTSFEPVVAQLPQFSHTLIDLPGYGRSAWPASPALPGEAAPPNGGAGLIEPMSLEPLADHLAAWLRQRPPTTVIGHSMGGVLAVMLAERGAASAIVDIDGNVTRGDCTFSAQTLPYSEAEFIDTGFAEMRSNVYAAGVAEPALRTYHAAMCFASPRMFYRQAHDLVTLSLTESMAPRLAALTIPALFVAGVPRGICEASRALLDRHRVRWIGIEPAGHWVYLDQVALFAAALEHFLA